MILEIIVNIFSIFANLAIVITLIYSIKAYKQESQRAIAEKQRAMAEKQRLMEEKQRAKEEKQRAKVNSDWQIKEATITFTNEILEKTDNLFDQIKDKFDNNTINISDLEKEENADLYKVIIQYLSLMERLSVGLNTKVYDLDIYARICCRKTIDAWEQLNNIVKDRRKQINNNLYIEFEDVVADLREWRKKTKEERGALDTNSVNTDPL